MVSSPATSGRGGRREGCRTVLLRTGDGRLVPFDPSRGLDHAYATAIHRAQGATIDTAHVVAAGGGRELAYVAMSRARHRTDIHTVAHSVTDAVEQLTGDWASERRQRWISDRPHSNRGRWTVSPTGRRPLRNVPRPSPVAEIHPMAASLS